MLRLVRLLSSTPLAAPLSLLAFASLPRAYAQTATQAATQTFTCAPKPAPGSLPLTASTLFSPAGDHPGFDLGTVPSTFSGGACSSDAPFFFSIPATDGNYRVTVVLGGNQASVTTLRAESRRLLLMEEKLPAGASHAFTFTANVRLPHISSTGTEVRLKPREIGALDWDNKLTLEFNGEHPSVRSITVTRAPDVPTLYLAGDSTVVDQDKEPWAAWGQMLPLFFGPGLSVANEAESGETIKSFVGERRYDKVMSTLKPGDFLMVQFAHNDQKPGNGFVSIPEYQTLLRRFITETRAKGATPILVTSMNRRTFDPAGHITNSLAGYPDAMREVAAAEHVPLIDLNALSKTLFEAMGPEGTLHAFVHYPANTFPGQPTELKDDTHFNSYGAYELARAVVQAVRDEKLPLTSYLRPNLPAYNPAHPDAFTAFHLPPSPAISTDTPYGR